MEEGLPKWKPANSGKRRDAQRNATQQATYNLAKVQSLKMAYSRMKRNPLTCMETT
jgi:hypothetical protein